MWSLKMAMATTVAAFVATVSFVHADTRYVDDAGRPILTHDEYLTLEQVEDFMTFMEGEYPYVSTETIGFSYTGKRMKVLKVSKKVLSLKYFLSDNFLM
jgi:hypothetical protein